MNRPTRTPATCAFLRVILTGFMGAGKTTVGGLLAGRLSWDFADSDSLVEAQAGMTVGEIFLQRGETAFREMEAQAIRNAGAEERLVLALGGGALELAATRAYLASLTRTLIVFLDAPLAMLTERCVAEAGGRIRPVLTDRGRLEERWRARLPWYRQAHLTVDTAGLLPETVAESILERLDPTGRCERDEAVAASAGISGKKGATA
jgi:shikimate kinase